MRPWEDNLEREGRKLGRELRIKLEYRASIHLRGRPIRLGCTSHDPYYKHHGGWELWLEPNDTLWLRSGGGYRTKLWMLKSNLWGLDLFIKGSDGNLYGFPETTWPPTELATWIGRLVATLREFPRYLGDDLVRPGQALPDGWSWRLWGEPNGEFAVLAVLSVDDERLGGDRLTPVQAREIMTHRIRGFGVRAFTLRGC